MNTELSDQHKKFKVIVENNFVPLLHEKIDAQISFLEQVSRLQRKILNEPFKSDQITDALRKTYTYKKALFNLVEPYFEAPKDPNFDIDFSSFNLEAQHYLEGLEEEIQLPQTSERFKSHSGDSVFLRFGKWWKRLFFTVSKWPERISNGFRKLFKKETKPLKPWYQQIQFKNLTAFYLQGKLSIDLLELVPRVYQALIDSSKVCWKIDAEIDKAFEKYLYEDSHNYTIEANLVDEIQDEISKLKALKADLLQESTAIYDRVFQEYSSVYEKTGTIEVSNKRFSASKIKKQHKALNSKYKFLITGWSNTLLVLSDDWEIDLELYIIIYSGLEVYRETLEVLKRRVQLVISKKLDEIKAALKVSENNLKASANEKDLKTLLEKELSSLREKLAPTLLPEANNLILAQDFPALVNNIESEVDKLIQSISTRRSVMKGESYNKPIRTSALSFISPYELINFESWPLFLRVLKSVKLAITDRLNEVQKNITDIGQIAEFNLESALSLFENNDKDNDPGVIAVEGIERTIEKVDDITIGLNSLTGFVEQELYEGLEKFHKELIRFTYNENIFDIRVRIARGKALEKSTIYKEKLMHSIRNFIPAALIFARTKYRKTASFVTKTFKKIGIVGQQKDISTELADFLAETEKSIDQLPFVYQRLFRTEPLTDVNFFEGRKAELMQLNNAYNNWTKGRFASVSVIGEKGSGVTTLLNFFVKDLGSSSEVCRFSLEDHLESGEELLNFFSTSFDDSFKSFDDLTEFLNQRKRLVILENIQKLYLKRVGGFEALRLFSELISLTSKHTFWVTGCTKYAWDYFGKTINLSDHFSYLVPLKEFDDEAIVNMINKRHRVSGYNVLFEPSPVDLNHKKFKRLNEVEQQKALRDSYFSSLNKISRSNVSLALIYWLRSTKQITGNTIVIGSLKDIDFSFMNNLPANKVFVLVNLLFHDGMTEEGFCKVTGYSASSARAILQPMFEDGIIILNNGVYFINPLLYRQTVLMLRKRNLIH